jgi:hypothetical protein
MTNHFTFGFLASLVISGLLAASPGVAPAAQFDCGQPQSSGDEPLTSDALAILRAAVGQQVENCEGEHFCVCDVDNNGSILTADALRVLRAAVGQVVTLDCGPDCGGNTTTTTLPEETTTTTLPDVTTTTEPEPTTTTTLDTPTTTLGTAGACPATGELVLYAGIGQFCDTNADCPVGTCEDDSRCHTITRLDSGWTGLAHNSDINDGVVTRGFLDCPSAGPVCGQCNVV